MENNREYRTIQKTGQFNFTTIVHTHKDPERGFRMPTSQTIGQRFVQSNLPLEELMLSKARIVCSRHKLELEKLSAIQRVFLMRYRCQKCGLVPLYYLDPCNLKKARCRMCGEHVKFSNDGKYGRIRKEIVMEIVAEVF